MSPERRNEIRVSAMLTLTVAHLLGAIAFAFWIGGTKTRVDQVLSNCVLVNDLAVIMATTERHNTNWVSADVWGIWERNHADRGSVIGRMP